MIFPTPTVTIGIFTLLDGNTQTVMSFWEGRSSVDFKSES
jgi:hypothetical protein